MACPSGNASTLAYEDSLHTLVTKCVALTVLLVAVFGGNVLVLLRMAQRSRKWSPCHRLVQTLAVIGILNGFLNVSVYFITTVSGRWMFGGVFCQLHGLFGTVILNAWIWILVIASFERFVKLLLPSEHASFFSEVNTKIMIWGSVLLLIVMYLGPVYGWGEYSFFRGKLDLLLAVKNNSSSSSTALLGSALTYFSQLAGGGGENPMLTNTMWNLTYFFQDLRQIHLRRPRVTAQGLILPVRAENRGALQCLWDEFLEGALTHNLQSLLASNETLSSLEVPGFDLHLSIKSASFQVYNDVHIPYQKSATCSLDYSPVNEHVYSFVGFSSLCNLVVPVGLMMYFYCRIFWSGLQKLCMFSRDGVTPVDAQWTRILAYTGFLSLFCHLPFTVASVASGLAVYIPASVHFSVTVLVYFSTSLLAWLYLGTMRDLSSANYGEPNCCTVMLRLEPTQGHRSMLSDIHQRLLSRPNSASTSPYKPSACRATTVVATSSGGNIDETEL